MTKTDFDAVIVGSGPNGLAAGIRLQQAGLSVLLVEGNNTIGGGLRSKELTLPGFVHDVCSAIHPMAAGSPYMSTLPLHEHGLDFIYPEIAAAHPFDNGTAAVLKKSITETAELLGADKQTYLSLMEPTVRDWPKLAPDVLGPLPIPKYPIAMAEFGLKALPPSTLLAKRFRTMEARGLWGGMAAHNIQPLNNLATSAIGLVLMAVGHLRGWPIPKGGSQQMANAMASYFVSLGGKIETGYYVKKLEQLPSAKAVLLDVTPRQLLEIAGHRFSSIYKWQLNRYRYGMGVFKIDWALDGPIPFTAPECRNAGTIHIGNTFEEIAATEKQSASGQHPDKPFVLLAQQSLFDPTRAPAGKQVAWAYCHVPNGSTLDRTEIIEKQVERFAPGFRDLIIGRSVMNTAQIEAYNPNYIGGDINGGVIDVQQLYTRPVISLSPYRTSAKGIYICSSSTPPGGGYTACVGFTQLTGL
ncbi:Protein p49 [Adhaeribacter pallidiroseus]|uniref:Protein p49 n=1 Tax=Adhaeribacter pallidiroseus TaxID=2072847 RepID=A0A369QLZ2_9BACT|nr:Protein p49 [Adhaeribacter pallidiroseus]